MTITADDWSYEVEIRLDRFTASTTLRRINTWLTSWQMPYGVRSSTGMGPSIMRVCFAEERFARAFQLKFGGRAMGGLDDVALGARDSKKRPVEASIRFH